MIITEFSNHDLEAVEFQNDKHSRIKYDISRDSELEMGTVFDDCTDKAHSDHYDIKMDLLSEEIKIKESRNLLRTAMENVGFTAYQYEWWHFDIGNIFWGRIVQKPTVFGPLFGDHEWPNGMMETK